MEVELARRRIELNFVEHKGKVRFEHVVISSRRAAKTWLSGYAVGSRPLLTLTAPVIYSLILPFGLLHAFISLYQTVCFRVYGVALVRRRDYVVFDRAASRLPQRIEKLN